MSRKRPKRPKTRTGPAQDSGASLRIVVAASPGTEVTIEPELDLIKAALLYGGEVTLLSATTTMFLGVEGFSQFSMTEQIKLIRKVAPYLLEEKERADLVEGIDQLEAVLSARSKGSRGGRLLQAQLKQMFKPMQESLANEMATLFRDGKVDQLADARAKGLLKIESADPGTAADLVVHPFSSLMVAGVS
jgi:hypothetical protein